MSTDGPVKRRLTRTGDALGREPFPTHGPGGRSHATGGRAEATTPEATSTGRVWVATTVAVLLLVLLIIFIAENTHKVTISFLGATGTLPAGLAMLAAAVAGALITLLIGTTRILQLRREVRRHKRAHSRRTEVPNEESA